MKCEDLKEQFIEYIDGSLYNQDRAIVDEHLFSCETCSEEVANIKSLCLKLNGIELEQPSENLKKNFDHMINSRKIKQEESVNKQKAFEILEKKLEEK